MAFRFALTVLCMAAVCSSSLASPTFYRLQRAAEPAAASNQAKQQPNQVIAQVQQQQPNQIIAKIQQQQQQNQIIAKNQQQQQQQPNQIIAQIQQQQQQSPAEPQEVVVQQQVPAQPQQVVVQQQFAQARSFQPQYVQPQPKAIVFQNVQPQPVFQVAQISQPAPAGYQAIQVNAAPSPVPSAKSIAAAAAVTNNVPSQQAQVTGQSYEFNPADNSFSYSFQTNNGISQQAKGYFNQNGKYVQEGSYTSYTPEGVPVSISYIADENGYQAVGDAIPQPDPVIAKSIAYLRSLPPSAEDNQS